MPTNLYGPNDNFDLQNSHVLPALIRKFHEAKEARANGQDASVKVWGTGNAQREFLHVDDAADAVVLAAERYDAPEPVNVGTGSEIAIRDLAQKIARLTGFSGRIGWDPSKPNGQMRRRLDTTRAREAFGFDAKIPLDEGLAQTITWWRDERRAAGR